MARRLPLTRGSRPPLFSRREHSHPHEVLATLRSNSSTACNPQTAGGTMSKLLTALIAAGFVFGLDAAVAQNVDSEKDKARMQDQATQDKEQAAKPSSSSQQQGQSNTNPEKNKADSGQPVSGQAAKPPQDCSKLSGKDKDKCLQATPA